MARQPKITQLEPGHMYRIAPFVFVNGDDPKPKYVVPLSQDEKGNLKFILLTSRNRFPETKKVTFGETTFRDKEESSFASPKPAFVLPEGLSVTKKFKMPKDTFIYVTCFHNENRSTMGRILGNANDIEDKGALHPGLMDKLQAFHAKHVNISGAEKERMYENHGLVTSADGRARISRHERRSLQAIGLTELDIKTLEITGDVTVSWFYSRPYKGNGDPPPVEHSSVRFCLKSDGVHVVSPDGKRSTLAVLVVSQYDGLLSYSSKYPADGKIIKDFAHRKKTGSPDVGNR